MVGVADGCWVLGIGDVVLDYACLEVDVGREAQYFVILVF
jgi:hypothetical protein